MDVIEEFKSALIEGDIRFRDNLQFELKSEFFINPTSHKNTYKQEVFLFIPNTLQVNTNNYSRKQFYLDQTNLIRYKTPQISLKNLIEPENLRSPLIRLKNLIDAKKFSRESYIRDELKLFGNIFKASLRDQIHKILDCLESKSSLIQKNLKNDIEKLFTRVENVRIFYLDLQFSFFLHTKADNPLRNHFRYVDEFLSNTIEYYFTALLKISRSIQNPYLSECDALFCKLIIKEQQHREAYQLKSSVKENNGGNESILYRESLLNKYILEALHLQVNRSSFEERHGDIVSSIAAGIAMLVYLLLFAWKSPTFVINSIPFILLGVILYILKDRLKEGLKRFYVKQAFRWFPDYSTKIKNQNGTTVGDLEENFTFIEEKDVPKDLIKMRNKEFNEEFPDLKRRETIIHYKREVTLYRKPLMLEKKSKGLTILFRYNIHRFLEKASNAIQPNIQLDKDSDIIERLLTKVYHLNIIIVNNYFKSKSELITEIKRFRVVVDKFGIKRVEQLGAGHK